MHYKRMVLSMTMGSLAVVGLLLALGVAVLARPQPAPAQTASQFDPTDVISDAWRYLETQQLPNGGFPGWTPGEADEITTIKVILALAADRRPVSFLTSVSGTTALDYLETQAYSYTRDVTATLLPGRVGMLMAAVAAGDGDPYAFGVYAPGHGSAGLPINLVQELEASYNPATGAYSTTASPAGTVNQWWAIIGLAAAQEPVPALATNYLLGLQEADGGWGYGRGGDVDATAYVLQALLASGHVLPTDTQMQEGLGFLRAQQNDQGGWGYWWGPDYYPSADSTAAAIQALVAVGYTPATESWAVASGDNPQTALAAFQAPDGSFSYNALGTAHAIAGLAEAPLPILDAEGMAHRALSWLAGQQSADGGFGGASATADIVVAFGAAGVDAHTVQSAQGKSPVDFLVTRVPTYNADGGEMGKLVLAAVASGEDPHSFGGYNLVVSLTQHISPTGEFGTNNQFRQALGILALAAAEEAAPPTTTQWLRNQQLPGGGWAWVVGSDADVDTTALAIQALIAAGETPTATSVVSAVDFLRTAQNNDAGFCYDPVSPYGTDSNTDSTAAAIQALLAAGEDLSDWTRNGRTPLEALRHFQKSDGVFVYQWGGWGGPVDSAMATYHAIPALPGQAHPIVPQVLETFTPVCQGPDPDRTVAAPMRAAWGKSVDVVIPFGSDLDEDGSVELVWREADAASWTAVDSGDIHRADGHYTATLPLTRPVSYEFQATFEDPDGVQFGSQMSGTAQTPPFTLEPHTMYLPLVVRSS
jgi:prenyltransferase beta subunit